MILRTKRNICLLLLVVMVAAMAIQAIPAMAEESSLKNVALGCSYTSSAPYTVDADKYIEKGEDNYRIKKGNELTDGKKGTSGYGSEWYAFYNTATYTVTIDLGSVTNELVRVSGEFREDTAASVSLPTSVKVSGSQDGTSFTDLGEMIDLSSGNNSNHDFRLDLPDGTSARYIRLTIGKGSGMFVFLSEVEVFTGYIEELSFRTEDVYISEDGTLRGIPAETSAEDFLAMLNTAAGVTLLNANGEEKTDALMATGDMVEKRGQSGEPHRYTVVVLGDINGDGMADAVDYLLVKRSVLETYTITGVALIAADVQPDGTIDATDYLLLKRHVLGTFNIYDTKPEVEKDGRGDVTEEFKDMDTSDAIETIERYPMTLQRSAESTYTMTCETYGGTLLLTLYRTKWGTYNLGKWQLTDEGKTHVFIAGATDWEYVYRVAPSAGAGVVWSGGNHSNEKMRSLAFYNGVTDEEISLSVGESVAVENLKIVEETTLYWDPAGDDGKYDYEEDNRYCNAVRTYTIVGPQIRLAVDYSYMKDAYYDLSYTCMFPIQKQYGLYCAFLDGEENLLSVVETLKKGDPSYNGAMYKGNAAERCIMWGYDGMEKYKFDVRVLTPETSTNNFNNPDKTFFWDMNTTTNKLYFSKFPSGSGKEKVAAGSEIHTECQWTFYE